MSQFHPLVDRTCFDIVRRSVNRPGSAVTDVLFVKNDSLLCEMAEVLTKPVTMARRQRLWRWFEEGKFAVGTNTSPARHTDTRWLDVHSIDRDALCDVLYLPPYYLVHLAGGHASSCSAELER